MASVSAVALNEVIIPIVPTFRPEDVHTVKVENKWRQVQIRWT